MISTHVDTSAFPPRALLSDGKVGATLVALGSMTGMMKRPV